MSICGYRRKRVENDPINQHVEIELSTICGVDLWDFSEDTIQSFLYCPFCGKDFGDWRTSKNTSPDYVAQRMSDSFGVPSEGIMLNAEEIREATLKGCERAFDVIRDILETEDEDVIMKAISPKRNACKEEKGDENNKPSIKNGSDS